MASATFQSLFLQIKQDDCCEGVYKIVFHAGLKMFSLCSNDGVGWSNQLEDGPNVLDLAIRHEVFKPAADIRVFMS